MATRTATAPVTPRARGGVAADHACRFLIHDRDSIFSVDFDRVAENIGLRVVKTPPKTPQANAFCERVIGTMRRECFDWIIPFREAGLRSLVREWVAYYNHLRPHMALGPGIPDPTPGLPAAPQMHRHRIPDGYHVSKTPVLGGLHRLRPPRSPRSGR